MPLEEIWSGGQIGADIAGLRAAKAAGLPTGGWIPLGYRTIAGSRRQYASLYGLREHASWMYQPRTAANVRETDGTLILGDRPESAGSALTRSCCEQRNRPFLVLTIQDLEESGSIERVAQWIADHLIRRLNIAGNTDAPEELLERWLEALFRLANEGASSAPSSDRAAQ